jgi:hypothetical protein
MVQLRTCRWIGLAFALSTSLPAHAYLVRLDTFSVTGASGVSTVNFNDPFSDGIPPPSGPNGPNTYLTAGVNPLGTETGGKLILDGSDSQPSAVFGFNFETAILATALSSGSAISVRGIFDLLAPAIPTEGYSIRLSDQFGGSLGNDDVRLGVFRALDGDVSVLLIEVNQMAGTFFVRASHDLTPTELANAQIELGLDVSAAGVTTGLYGFGGPLTALGTTIQIYDGETFTRAGLVVSTPIPAPGTLWLATLGLCALALSLRPARFRRV